MRLLAVEPPDLTLPVATGPVAAALGETVPLSWTVTNAGPGAARTGWTDSVYLSLDNILDATDTLLVDVPATDRVPLAAAASYSVAWSVRLPNTGTGDRFLLFVTDRAALAETDETNNLRAVPIRLGAADLEASAVSASLAAAVPGQRVTVRWTVTNRGEQAAGGPWLDRVYLSADGTLTNATLAATVSRTAALPAGGSYNGTAEFTLPDLADADYTVLVVADAADAVPETNPANNTAAGTVPLVVRHPDLAVTIDTAPASAQSGLPLTVAWTTANVGTAAPLGSWVERVYLSTDATVSADDRVLGEFTFDALAAGSAAPRALIAELPIDLSGNLFLLVKADATDVVREPGAEANNTRSQAVSVALSPYCSLKWHPG